MGFRTVNVSLLVLIVLLVIVISIRVMVILNRKPTIERDYYGELSEEIRDGRDEGLNCFQDMMAISKRIDESSLSSDELSSIYLKLKKGEDDAKAKAKVFLESNNQIYLDIVAAMSGKDYWVEYGSMPEDLVVCSKKKYSDYLDKYVLSKACPSDIHNLFRFLRIKFLYDATLNDTSSAIETMKEAAQFVKFFRCENTLLINQLVYRTLSSLPIDIATKLTSSGNLSWAQLVELDKFIKSYELARFDYHTEKVLLLDVAQRGFTSGDDGKLAGRSGMDLCDNSYSPLIKILLGKEMSRSDFLAKDYEKLDLLEKSKQVYCSQYKELYLKKLLHYFELTSDSSQERTTMLAMLGIDWDGHAQKTATSTAIAVLLFKEQQHRLPTDLEELVEYGYIESIPLSEYTGAELEYVVEENSFSIKTDKVSLMDDSVVTPLTMTVKNKSGRPKKDSAAL